ncbi:hypothetical protein N7508_006475 [Penicillium antarcticum]|uniref:uncharacterized protein n=1 Tax=Penicillium antarcticum TaxID=416450 RepID=UPI00238BA3EE|nr:uncharacterized protein N7508_006475 [Penicillium antarcticum]KAJ5301612.1 hypothetical protein N7508_006475 [Penicillium antarcticum]
MTAARFGQKFDNFNIIQTIYKTVDGHDIRADILASESLDTTRKTPVIARFHGGGLSRGDSIYADWFPKWVLELAEAHNAVIVSPNYRLLPEATGVQILEDVDDFWTWLHSEALTKILSPHQIDLDLDRVLAAGDSAGGILSIYLTLSYPDQLRAGTAAYPQLSWDPPALFPSSVCPENAEVPSSFIDEYLTSLPPGYVESSDLEVRRATLQFAISCHRRGPKFYTRGSEGSPHREKLFALQRLDHPDTKLPRGGLAIIHGTDDDDVLADVSDRFVSKAKVTLQGKQGVDNLVLCLRPGGHGFDVDTSFKEKWLVDALRAALDTWLE